MADPTRHIWTASLRSTIKLRLDRFQYIEAPPSATRRAAVAFTIVPVGNGTAAFLLTKRSHTLKSHPGQWALPGGLLEQGESAAKAALRELEEELGLRLSPNDVLGRLDDFVTRSGFAITPVVAWAAGRKELAINPQEVASVHRIPLDEIDSSAVPRFVDGERGARLIQMPLAGSLIHAPTGAIIYQAREVLLRGSSTRVFGFKQPRFAWK